MNIQRERAADIIRAEFPHRTVYTLIALNFAIIVLGALLWYGFDKWQRKQDSQAFDRWETQAVWNSTFKAELKGLSTEIELSSRLAAIELAQDKQTAVLDAIAEKLGIE